MYRTTKKKVMKRATISAAITIGALATGAGVASASAGITSSTAGTSTVATVGAHATTPDAGPNCPGGAGGLVSAVTSTSITVTGPGGAATMFTITSSTTFTKDRVAATAADLAIAEQVRITPTAAGSTTASSIDIEQPSVMGKVTAVSGDTIAVTGPNGATATIIVGSATTYSKNDASATLSDVTVGSFLFAQGTFASGSTTTLDATTVGIGIGVGPVSGGPGDGRPGGPGIQSGGRDRAPTPVIRN